MTFKQDKIRNDIEKLRSELILSGMVNGLNHPDTIKLSQKLDRLLNRYK